MSGRTPQRVEEPPGLAPRARDSHKGTYGRVLIVAGSRTMPGAAILAARAALRSGAGLVTVAIPEAIGNAVAAAVPEATQIHVPEPPVDRGRAEPGEALLSRLSSGAEAVAVGPGLGLDARAHALVAAAFARAGCPLVVDADALTAAAARPELRPAAPERCVWTPHPGELQRLTGEKPSGEEARIAAAARFVERFGGVVVLKGHRTVVHDGARYYVNPTGNPGMATGGAGDVLAGVVAALLAQGLSPFDAAALGTCLHGAAGDLAAAALGEPSLTAGDIVDHLPAAFRAHMSARAEPGGHTPTESFGA